MAMLNALGAVQAMLGRVDGTLKQIFAWYASLPFLTGQVAWDQLKHTHKGIMPGHILLFLTDFKVITMTTT